MLCGETNNDGNLLKRDIACFHTGGVDEGQVVSRVVNVGVDDDLGEPEPHEQDVAVGQKGTCEIAKSSCIK